MSNKVIRKDKTCLNCRHVVENKFCPNCGQENADTRKTFHNLFIHFFEDLTHYENAFWKTIKNLLFKPSTLTKEYLSGKRLSYLAPVRLYIFISFLCFFVISLFPDKMFNLNNIKKDNIKNRAKTERKRDIVTFEFRGDTIDDDKKKSTKDYIYDSIKKAEDEKIPLTKEELEIKRVLAAGNLSKSAQDTLNKMLEEKIDSKNENKDDYLNFGSFHDLKSLDSLRKFGKGDDAINDIEYYLGKKVMTVKANNTKEQVFEKGKESMFHNFPKVLLIYMPIFAFMLWLFHNKKRWYYFDHGIFTLHYFSFLLLIYLAIFLSTRFLDSLVDNGFTNFLFYGVKFLGYGWCFYYFFPAHHRFYGETRIVSFIKSAVLFFLNMIFFVIILTAFFFYTIINIQ